MIHEIESAEVIRDSGKAILVEAPDFDEPEWVPKFAIHDDSEVYGKGHDGTLIVYSSWAEKKGWI